MSRDLVISASRTKDTVRFNATPLFHALSGRRPVRFGLNPKSAPLKLKQIGALVLWTCDPENLTAHRPLRTQLAKLVNRGAVITLQLTVTGLANTALEPGLPEPDSVAENLVRAFDAELLSPAAVTLRYDPFAEYKLPGGKILSNANIESFESVLNIFLPLGIRRVVVSEMDYRNYDHVQKRLARLGIEPQPLDSQGLVIEMDRMATAHDAAFSVCCHPQVEGITNRFGCIDGRHLNELADLDHAGPFTERLHNEIGKQRPACRCTYSRDIGHSKGFRNCYSFGSGCMYCYAQHGLPSYMETEVRKLLD